MGAGREPAGGTVPPLCARGARLCLYAPCLAPGCRALCSDSTDLGQCWAAGISTLRRFKAGNSHRSVGQMLYV